jgi:hypothetical protein
MLGNINCQGNIHHAKYITKTFFADIVLRRIIVAFVRATEERVMPQRSLPVHPATRQMKGSQSHL